MNISQLNFVNQIKKSKDERRARWLTLGFLLLSVGASVFLGLVSYVRENGVSLNLPELKVKEKPAMSTRLNRWAEKELASLPGQWAAKVILLESGQSWSYQAKQPMDAGSLMNLPVVAVFYNQVELGEYDLNATYALKQEDKHSEGVLVNEPAGEEFSWRRILDLALSHSDDTAFRILREELGNDLITQKIKEWEMTATDLDKNLTSAEDVALFFEKLHQGELVNKTHQQMMIESLTNTAHEEQIPAGIPEGINVAHKVGDEKEALGDAGIVFVPDNPLVMVIMSQDTNLSQAKGIFSQLAKEIYWQVIEN